VPRKKLFYGGKTGKAGRTVEFGVLSAIVVQGGDILVMVTHGRNDEAR
jgi:hypothetical protein